MIVLDTNVISELWRITPDANVLAWVDRQMAETLYLSAITLAELRFGLASMPQGKRRATYQTRLEKHVLQAFANRVLPFDLSASKAYACLMARAKANGNAIGTANGYIAAIVKAHNFYIATQHTTPFEAAGLKVINPWIAPLK